MGDPGGCRSFDATDRLVLRYAEELTRRNRVDDALYAELASVFDRQQLFERHIVMVRTFVVPPTDVHAHPICGHVTQRMIQNFYVTRGAIEKVRRALVAIHRVAAHREIRRVDLHEQSGCGDRFVLQPHRLGDRFEIVVLRAVEIVRLK